MQRDESITLQKKKDIKEFLNYKIKMLKLIL